MLYNGQNPQICGKIQRKYMGETDKEQEGENLTEQSVKDRIGEALLEFSARKSLDKITVRDLVEACGISRQSFYYHYQDIFEVVEWVIHKKADKLMEKILQTAKPEEAMDIFVDFAFDEKDFILYLLASKHRAFIERLLAHNMRQFLKDLIIQKVPDLPFRYGDMDTILSFYTYGLSGLLLEKSQTKNISRAQLKDQLKCLLPTRPRSE